MRGQHKGFLKNVRHHCKCSLTSSKFHERSLTHPPPPPCLGTALRKNRPLVPRHFCSATFFPTELRCSWQRWMRTAIQMCRTTFHLCCTAIRAFGTQIEAHGTEFEVFARTYLLLYHFLPFLVMYHRGSVSALGVHQGSFFFTIPHPCLFLPPLTKQPGQF